MDSRNKFAEQSPEKDSHAQAVQRMFSRIARRYDLMNRLMTAGQDVRWRREVIRLASIPPKGSLLDIGAGTGDLCREALRQQPHCLAVAADFTLEMMRAGRHLPPQISSWCAANAESLPFPDETFDAVVSGFLLRNVSHLPLALREQYRVLKPGGKIVCLDTTRPTAAWFSPFVQFHLNRVIPLLGGWITGDSEAYTYLPQSTQNFLLAEDLAEQMRLANFRQVNFKRWMLGTIAIHWGEK